MISRAKKFILPFFAVYASFLVQSLILENVRIGYSSPNLLIALIILMSIDKAPWQAALLGAFGGLLTDSLCSRLFGMHILAYMYLAAAVSVTVDRKISNSPLLTAWACFAYTALFQLASALSGALLGIGADAGKITSAVLVRGVFSALTALAAVMARERLRASKKAETPEGSDGK